MFRHDRGIASLGLLVIVAANALYLSGFSSSVDAGGSMDPLYIYTARLPLNDIAAHPPAWGPLYALWMKPLRALLHDPIAVFHANLALVSLALSVCVYAFVWLTTHRVGVALACGLAVLVSDSNLPLRSNAYSVALIVALAGACLAERAPGELRRTVLAAAALVAGYVRPELYVAGWMLLARAWWEQRSARAPRAVAALAIGAGAVLGTPIFTPYHDNDRLFLAFREHFAWNWARWNGQWRPFEVAWQSSFGDASSVIEALRADPGLVLRHLADNLRGTLVGLAAAFDHEPWFGGWATVLEDRTFLLVALGVGAWTIVGAASRRRFLASFGARLADLAVLAVPALAAAVFVYPEIRYLMIPHLLAIVAVGWAASVVLPRWSLPGWGSAAVLLTCLAVVPRPFAASATPQRPVVDAVHLIRSLDLPPPVHVLAITDGIAELLGDGYVPVRVWERGDVSLEDYLRQQHIDVIVTAERGRESFVVDDPYWNQVQLEPESTGYTAVPSPGPIRVWRRLELPDAAVISGTR